MASDKDRLRQRALKLLALARRGVGGERENADRMLAKLLAKHGMTLEEIDASEDRKTMLRVGYRTEDERSLLIQVIGTLMNTHSPDLKKRRGEKALLIEVTEAQRVDILLHFEAYRAPLAEQLKQARATALTAFYHANRIFPATASERSSEPSPEINEDELEALVAAIRRSKPVAVHKQITSSAGQA